MPTWSRITKGPIENMLEELQSKLSFIFSRLDSKNIREIDSNITTVKNITKCTGDIKIQVVGGYLEVYKDNVYQGKVQLL